MWFLLFAFLSNAILNHAYTTSGTQKCNIISKKSSQELKGTTSAAPETYNSKFKNALIRGIMTSSIAILTASKASNAGFFSSDEQDAIDQISNYQKPVAELLDQLKPSNIPNAIGVYGNTQMLKGGPEDSAVVLNYLETYIRPCQEKMEKIAPKLQLGGESDTKITTLPLLMKGHIIELRQAIQEMKAESQAREVAEVQETLADFLKLASMKYNVQPFIVSRPLTDSELFGPLSCEFWGRKRMPGSNYCD